MINSSSFLASTKPQQGSNIHHHMFSIVRQVLRYTASIPLCAMLFLWVLHSSYGCTSVFNTQPSSILIIGLPFVFLPSMFTSTIVLSSDSSLSTCSIQFLCLLFMVIISIVYSLTNWTSEVPPNLISYLSTLVTILTNTLWLWQPTESASGGIGPKTQLNKWDPLHEPN